MKIVNPAALAAPKGYNHGVLFPAGGHLLFVAGQVAWDRDEQAALSPREAPEGSAAEPRRRARASGGGAPRAPKIVSTDFARQFDQALGNVLAVVREAGGGPESIAKLTIFVTTVAEYAAARQAVGQAYRARMGRHYPAMTLVEVQALLEPAAKVEIEAIAVLP